MKNGISLVFVLMGLLVCSSVAFAGDEKKDEPKKEETKAEKDAGKKCSLTEEEKNKKLFSGDALPAECK